MQDLREQIAEAVEAAIDNVHDMDVTFRDYAEASADAILELIKGERDTLRAELAAARGAALEEAFSVAESKMRKHAKEAYSGEPVRVFKGGEDTLSQSAAKCYCAGEIAEEIRALKSTPAPREVTPQEAAPDWEGFGRAIMNRWDEHLDVDALDRFELALKHGLLRKIPGGFDPEVHVAEHCDAERGDDWYEPTYSAISQTGEDK